MNVDLSKISVDMYSNLKQIHMAITSVSARTDDKAIKSHLEDAMESVSEALDIHSNKIGRDVVGSLSQAAKQEKDAD